MEIIIIVIIKLIAFKYNKIDKEIMKLQCIYMQTEHAGNNEKQQIKFSAMNIYKQTGTSDCTLSVCGSDLLIICWRPYNSMWLGTPSNYFIEILETNL